MKPAISNETRARIKGFLEGFIDGLVIEYKGREILKPDNAKEYLRRSSLIGELKPFHAAIIPSELLRINAFERGFSTRLGNTFEECARLIALEHHQEAHRSYDVTTYVSRSANAALDRQVEQFEHAAANKQNQPLFSEMKSNVLNERLQNDLVPLTVRADLYILSNDGIKYFFEIKGPKPNKDQCLRVIQRLLRFHLIHSETADVRAYYGMAYNPYGSTRSTYRHSFALNYLPFNEIVIIGQDFWSIVGGASTQEELVEIYLEVGQEKGKYMLDNLAFGF